MKIKYPHIRLDVIGSTNDYAWELLSTEKVDEFTVISASFQTSGRGQGKNTWHSNEGENLLCSIIIFPVFLSTENFFYLNKITALSIVNVLEKHLTGFQVWIKWPNDIYVNDQKIAGILIQNELSTNGFTKSVIGIGLNINQLSFPEELPNPVSVRQLIKVVQSPDDYLAEIMNCLSEYYYQLKNEEFQLIDEAYMQKLYAFNIRRSYRDLNGIFTGIITDVRKDGKLVIRREDQTLSYYDFKEIEFM